MVLLEKWLKDSVHRGLAQRRFPRRLYLLCFPTYLIWQSFHSLASLGIRASHKIRGDPMIDGVAAFLGRLVSCSSTESKTEFESFLPARLGNWQPELQPTEEPRTLISSRLKTAKAKGVINEKRPVVPSILKDKQEIFCEEEERVKTRFFSTCWRCSRRCQFFIARRKNFPKFLNFNTE